MKSIKALIVEDNLFMATVLAELLRQNHAEIILAHIANCGEEALKYIPEFKPNIVFLDVELPDMSGFEMLSRLKSIHFKTIFTTAHSEYAIKAFRFNALDYLVKPIKEEELREAVDRFKISSQKTVQEEIKNAMKNLTSPNVEEQRLILHTQNGYLKLPINQIITIESERNYSFIYLTNNKKELVSKTLSYFEDILENKGFFRCHRSFLVNRLFVDSMSKDDFVLKNGRNIPISRRKKPQARLWFAE